MVVEPVVKVRRHWNDWREATYATGAVEGLHWSTMSGGIGGSAPGYFLHGYVRCDGMIDGEVAHSGIHGPCPHRIKVCIVKKANERCVFDALAEQAGPKPQAKARLDGPRPRAT